MARIVESSGSVLTEAVHRLRAGWPVAFPTETVYGLGADTFNPVALQLVYTMKGRPPDNPLIAHVADVEQAQRVARGWDERCERLAEVLWPGPLALVLERDPAVPALATGGRDTIAVRCPRHRIALELLRRFKGPISAPSANRSGHVSPTTAQHVERDFAGEDVLIIDGGPCEIGVESTVLDMTASPPRVLRPGGVLEREIEQLIGPVEQPALRRQVASPGTSPRHYAPRTRAVMLEGAELTEALASPHPILVVLCFDPETIPPPHRTIVMPQGAGDYARVLYDALRRADDLGCARIIIQRPPVSNEMWRVVHDRLRRATRG